MFDILEALESYEIDIAEEGLGEKIAKGAKGIKDRIVTLLAKIAHVLKSFAIKLKGSIPFIRKESSIKNKATLVYVETVLKASKTVTTLVKQQASVHEKYNSDRDATSAKYSSEGKPNPEMFNKVRDRQDKRLERGEKPLIKFDTNKKLLDKLESLKEKAGDGGENIYGETIAKVLTARLEEAAKAIETLSTQYPSKLGDRTAPDTVALVAKFGEHVSHAIALITRGIKVKKAKEDKGAPAEVPAGQTASESYLFW